MALVTAVILMFLLIPVASGFLYVLRDQLRFTTSERQIKTARTLANNALVDFMRQFSQDYYSGHYDTASLARAESFYAVGFTSVSVTADSQNHTVFIEATGKYGASAQSPLARKTLYGLIQFVSDLTDYGTLINGNLTTSASNVTYLGKFWINGTWSITGSNVRLEGGPALVLQNVSGSASAVINGDLYYGGTSAGSVTVNGTKYNFFPDKTFPTLNLSYYQNHYNYRITTNNTQLLFNSNGTVLIGTTTISIPSTGMIIWGQNVNLNVRGTLRGRVTVVATHTGSGPGGQVIMNGDLVYANGTNSASSLDSFAALATRRINFTRLGANMTVCGVYFVNTGTTNMSVTGSSGRTFNFFGTRNQIMWVSGFTAGRNISFDPNLNRFPPPGLPERPVLVTCHIKQG